MQVVIRFQWIGPGKLTLEELYPSPDAVPPAAAVAEDPAGLREELRALRDRLHDSSDADALSAILAHYFPDGS